MRWGGFMLEGKVALVTGGSRGIGKAIALELASEGADIIINHLRHRSAAQETAEAIRQKGRQAHIIRANVGEPEKIEAMFAEIADKFGHLDIMVNNAASGVARKAMDLDERGWAWTMDINARAFLLCSQRAARLMEGRGGKIVAISSLGSRLVMPVYTAVGVSKAALEALTRYLAIEFAPQGITVNAIAAAVIGGASFAGGTGDLVGTFLGVLLLAVIRNGFVLLKGNPNWQSVVSGAIVFVAIAVDAYRRRKETRE